MGTLAGILKINPLGERRCLGYSSGHHRPCFTRIDADDLVGGFLRLGSWRLGQGDSIERDLWLLAEQALCKWHQCLMREFVVKWTAEVCRYQERERERERERHGELQARRGIPPSPTATSSLPSVSPTSITSPAHLCPQPSSSPLFDRASIPLSATPSPLPSDMDPTSRPTQAHMLSTMVFVSDPGFHSDISRMQAEMVGTAVPFTPATSLSNPLDFTTTTDIGTRPPQPKKKARTKVTRRSIEGECGICILPFSTDPDDGSFVGCVPMDIDEDEDDDDDDGDDISGGDESDDFLEDDDLGEGDEDEDCDDEASEGSGDSEDKDEDEKSAADGKEDNSIVWCKAQCGTNYHQSCLNIWIHTFKNEAYRRPTCPTCRAVWKN